MEHLLRSPGAELRIQYGAGNKGRYCVSLLICTSLEVEKLMIIVVTYVSSPLIVSTISVQCSCTCDATCVNEVKLV